VTPQGATGRRPSDQLTWSEGSEVTGVGDRVAPQAEGRPIKLTWSEGGPVSGAGDRAAGAGR
jgi:hypothetical protein